MTNWLSPNPFRVGGKDPATMSASEINRELDRLDKERGKINDAGQAHRVDYPSNVDGTDQGDR